MNSKEALKQYKEIYVDKTSNFEFQPTQEWYLDIIKQDLDRLEKLEKVIEILNDKFKFELGVSVVKEKYYYSLEFLYNNQYFTITQEQYELLKEVLGND